MSLSTETPLMPWVIADAVCGEVEAAFSITLPDEYRDELKERAEKIYDAQSKQRGRFWRQMRGARCREYLHMFMRHWLAAILVNNGVLPLSDLRDFANGKPLTQHPVSV